MDYKNLSQCRQERLINFNELDEQAIQFLNRLLDQGNIEPELKKYCNRYTEKNRNCRNAY